MHKGTDMGIFPCSKTCLCIHKVLSGTSSVIQCSSSKGTILRSSSSSSSRYTWASGVALKVVGVSSSDVSMLSEELYVSHLCTGLR